MSKYLLSILLTLRVKTILNSENQKYISFPKSNNLAMLLFKSAMFLDFVEHKMPSNSKEAIILLRLQLQEGREAFHVIQISLRPPQSPK